MNFPGQRISSSQSCQSAGSVTVRVGCVFITAGPITKLFARGGRRRVEDMCYDRRRAEACVDESAHHALANAGGREIFFFRG